MSQPIKIKNITLQGFRGAKDKFFVNFESPVRSLLVYGDNGTGKSTISDGIEWFFFDKINHLSSQEIAKHEGIRNKELKKEDSCYVEINFLDSSLNAQKQLNIIKNDKFKIETSNKTDAFENYIKQSRKEKFLIRNTDLLQFIVSPKQERLNRISDLIGYSDVIKLKDNLKKFKNNLNSLIRNKAFESQITSKKSELMQITKESVNTKEQFFSSIDSLISSFDIGFKIESEESLKRLEVTLSKIKPTEEIKQKISIVKILSNLESKKEVLKNISFNLDKFQEEFNKIYLDKNRLKEVRLESLLQMAKKIIESKVIKDESCPLCLQKISHNDLLEIVKHRIDELSTLKKSAENLKQLKNQIVMLCKNIEFEINQIIESNFINNTSAKNIKEISISIKKELEILSQLFSRQITFDNERTYSDVKMNIKAFDDLIQAMKVLNSSIKDSNDPRIELAKQITLAKALFKDIQNLKKEEDIINKQRATMEAVFLEFSRYQKEEMELFLSKVSSDMNNFFKFMNPSENIDQIKLKTLSDDEGDFKGISYYLNFRGTELEAPKKYLSESYLNCLGLCLFLSSVKIFNKKNNFFILDDVISSFDKNHRVRFADLLVEKFRDWQLIVLTHEYEWYSYLSQRAKNQTWLIKQTKWNDKMGSIIEVKTIDLKKQIENKISKGEEIGLGNLIGRYTENLLQKLCENLEVNLPFKKGERNEERGWSELFNSLQKRLKKKQTGLDKKPTFQRLSQMNFFRNKTSHGGRFEENLADMKAFYATLKEFEAIFTCSETQEKLSVKYFDAVSNTIRTKSGKLSYPWK